MSGPMSGPASGPASVPMTWRPALSRAAVLRHDPVRQAHLLIVPERIVVLNEEAAAIVGLCDGQRTVADIVEDIWEDIVKGGVAESPESVEADVMEFLDRVRAERWLR